MTEGTAPGSLAVRPNPLFRHRLMQRHWDHKAGSWDHEGSPGIESVVKAVLEAAAARPGVVAVDLGCGTGSLALPLAGEGAEVTAVDISPAMVARLSEKAALSGLEGVKGVVAPLEHFDLPPLSVDLVVSNYALHHLQDPDKEALVGRAHGWLRPGGRLVIGDMMFGRGSDARDWAIIGSKAAILARRGPGGWWRIAKNVVRFGLRLRERPVSMQAWERYFRQAGFDHVSSKAVVAEAGVAAGTKR